MLLVVLGVCLTGGAIAVIMMWSLWKKQGTFRQLTFSNILDWLVMNTVWKMATYKPETSISDLILSQSSEYPSKKVKIVSVHSKIPNVENCDENLLEMYQKKCTILTLNDGYARFRTSYVPYSVYFNEIDEEDLVECEKMLIEGLERTLFYFPTVGGRYRDLNPMDEKDLALLSEEERNLVKGRQKPFLVIYHHYKLHTSERY
ncbi:predicted protein [Naegleria gruberi]|uniref:Predicted protein n=1 Tax=Naegleria gruberi TaxID=5762 RepID=D2VQE9_NAEGR|nr:uncharacterized protein NAEGRDRAFT_80861 [Naegleria gruberi]EFC40935.1 predicted protein [Naegleria gruberi]|eukprot:XP_002673679.1 predicted protein [Naegleria gruberi strain NEG-M]